MRVRSQLNNSSWTGLAGALLLATLVAGCATEQPFQPMASVTKPSYGYKETRKDAQHYFVVYADSREAAAQNRLELRAAQIARTEGFPYFAFDQRAVNLVTVAEMDLVTGQPKSQFTTPMRVNDQIPTQKFEGRQKYYYAAGEISLLTEEQARINGNAMRVAEILARPGVPATP